MEGLAERACEKVESASGTHGLLLRSTEVSEQQDKAKGRVIEGLGAVEEGKGGRTEGQTEIKKIRNRR